MSRKFKLSSNYDRPSWYDSKSKTWFYTNKVVEVPENANYENIIKGINKNLLYEIFPEKQKEERDTIVASSYSRLLAKELFEERQREAKKIKDILKEQELKKEEEPKEEPKKEKLPDLDDMTKVELLSYADSKGIKVDRKAKKAIILEMLKN